MTVAVETNGVTKVFGGGKVAVDSVTMTIPPGSIHGIVGGNGAGKSTLLRMLTGLVEPTFGEVRILGDTMHAGAADIRQRLHYVGNDGDLFRSFRVMDLIRYAKLLYINWDDVRCNTLLAALELPPKRLVRNLSVGMKMQLRLLIALSTRPEVLILDEPTNGLDPVVKRQFLQFILQEAAHTGMTVLFATHQLEELERIADGVTVMYDGRVVATGMLDELKNQVKRVQAVLPNGLPKDLHGTPEVVDVEERGQFFSLAVQGDQNAVAAVVERLKGCGATYTEVLDVGFEELFRHTMQKEGYTRDGILLS